MLCSSNANCWEEFFKNGVGSWQSDSSWCSHLFPTFCHLSYGWDSAAGHALIAHRDSGKAMRPKNWGKTGTAMYKWCWHFNMWPSPSKNQLAHDSCSLPDFFSGLETHPCSLSSLTHVAEMLVPCFARRDLQRKEKQKRDEQERKKIEEFLGCTGLGCVGLDWQSVEEGVYRLLFWLGYVDFCIMVTCNLGIC